MRKKYLSDYVLEERADAGGIIQLVPVYRGKTYAFVLQGGKLRRAKTLYALLTALCALALLSAFLVNAPCGHRWYVMLPLAFAALPLFFQAESCLLLLRKETLTRAERDRTEQRTVFTSAVLAIFSFFSLAGHVVSMVRYRETWRDVVYLVAAAVIFCSAAVMTAKRDALKTKELSR